MVAVAGVVILVLYLLLSVAGSEPQLSTDAWGMFVLPKNDALAGAAWWPSSRTAGPASHDDLTSRLISLGLCPVDSSQCGTEPDTSDPFATWSPDAVWVWAKDAWASAETHWAGLDVAQLARAVHAQASVVPDVLGGMATVAADAVGHVSAVGLTYLQRIVTAVPDVVNGVVEATRPAVQQLAEITEATSQAASYAGATGFDYLQRVVGVAADTPAAARFLSTGVDTAKRVRRCIGRYIGVHFRILANDRSVAAVPLLRLGMGRVVFRHCEEERGQVMVGTNSFKIVGTCTFTRKFTLEHYDPTANSTLGLARPMRRRIRPHAPPRLRHRCGARARDGRRSSGRRCRRLRLRLGDLEPLQLAR